ncbi:MAG: hydroxymethylglutaryl-CoA lyase [Chloroflexota bacterium]
MDFLRICEVGLRDGLQNEGHLVNTAVKLGLLNKLTSAGLRYLEVASYVKPSAVPQMADSDQIMKTAVSRYNQPPYQFTGLVFNKRGYERALASGCSSIAIGLTVTEAFCQNNIRMTVAQNMKIGRELVEQAKFDGVWVRAYLSTAWVCPFEGRTPPERTIGMSEEIFSWGVDELAIADTIGHANPLEVGRMMEQLGRQLDMSKLAVHLHDTQALGMANVSAAIQAGVRIVDSSIGGLGGCPFAPGAAGNIATEDVAFLAHKLGVGTGIDFPALMDIIPEVETAVNHSAGGRIRSWWESHCQLEKDAQEELEVRDW